MLSMPFMSKILLVKKTDVLDSQWIAELGACGLLRASFIPPREIRSIRLLARYRTKTIRQISSEQNRMYKVLEYSGIRLTFMGAPCFPTHAHESF